MATAPPAIVPVSTLKLVLSLPYTFTLRLLKTFAFESMKPLVPEGTFAFAIALATLLFGALL